MSTDFENDSGKGSTVNLASYEATGYSPGAGPVRRILWYTVSVLVFGNPLFPFYAPKRLLLRLFGSRIGKRVVLKPRVNIKHPWRLSIGDYSWIGEGVWIDNLEEVTIGKNVCISQGAYLLTGNHNYKSRAFSLIVKPICIDDGAWIGAQSIVCPGVIVGQNAVLTVGSVLTRNAEIGGIYSGNPAQLVRTRVLSK